MPHCSACLRRRPAAALAEGGFQRCVCGALVSVKAFPALLRDSRPAVSAGTPLMEGDASCFHHAGKRAAAACGTCGRFVCALCDVELEGRHLCPGCLEAGATRGRLDALQSGRTLYDRLALALAIYPMLIFYFTLFTAPAALYYVIKYWKAPPSLVQPGKSRFVVAAAIAMLQLCGWALLFGVLFTRLRKA